MKGQKVGELPSPREREGNWCRGKRVEGTDRKTSEKDLKRGAKRGKPKMWGGMGMNQGKRSGKEKIQ